MLTRLKRLLRPDVPDPRTSPETKATLRALYTQWQQHPPCLKDAGLRVFSQFEEDGLLMAIFAAIGTTNKTFVDIGASDGIFGNTANLATNFGWSGVLIEGDPVSVARGQAWYATHPDTWRYPPTFVNAMVTRENVNDLIGGGIPAEPDLLSLDIDGNDYWILEAITTKPRVIICEANVTFGPHPVTVPYDPAFVHAHDNYYGAGAEALRRLCDDKGYRLVGANQWASNLLFVRRGIGEDVLPEVSLESVRWHPFAEQFSSYPTADRPLVRVD